MPVFVKVSGVWKTTSGDATKVSGIWKPLSQMYVKVSGVWMKALSMPDNGSMDFGPGNYSHTFTSNATVKVTCMYAGGGGSAIEGDGYTASSGDGTVLTYTGVTATCYGGGGGDSNGETAYDGVAYNNIGGLNAFFNNGQPGEWPGAGGGEIIGGAFAVTAGSTLSVHVGAGGEGEGGFGGNGRVILSWVAA